MSLQTMFKSPSFLPRMKQAGVGLVDQDPWHVEFLVLSGVAQLDPQIVDHLQEGRTGLVGRGSMSILTHRSNPRSLAASRARS